MKVVLGKEPKGGSSQSMIQKCTEGGQMEVLWVGKVGGEEVAIGKLGTEGTVRFRFTHEPKST